MTDNPTLTHQSFQPIFRLDARITNPDGTPSVPFYRMLTNMWNAIGLNGQPWTQVGNVSVANPNSLVVNDVNGETVATIPIPVQTGLTPEPAEPQSPNTSPFEFTAPVIGTLVVFAGAVEISRDAGATFYMVTLTGGAIPMLPDDQVKVSWDSSTKPTIIWLPSEALI